MEPLVQQISERLQKAYGERLVAVVLYGSAAAGDYNAKFSDYNVLCVLNQLTTKELADGEAIFRWWREQGSPSPLLLTEQEVITSTDCFAIEFYDIKRSHQLLYGKDVVSGLKIDQSFYRAQVEHDLRAKLLRLRQKAGGVLSDADLLRRMLLDSLSTFCVLFRHALILSGVEGPAGKRDVIAHAGRQFNFDPLPFNKMLDVREERIKAREVDPVTLLDSYLQAISVVIAAVDRLEK